MKTLHLDLTFVFLAFQYTKILKGYSVTHPLLVRTYIPREGATGRLRNRHRSAGTWDPAAEKWSAAETWMETFRL